MLLVAMPHFRVDGSVISFFVCISLRFQVPVIIGSVISFFVAVGGDEGDGDKGGAIDGLGLDFGEGGEGGEEGGSDGAGCCRRRRGGRGSVGSRAWHPSRPQLRRDKEEDELHLVLGFNEEDDLNCTCSGLR